jgi:hypothetical protein
VEFGVPVEEAEVDSTRLARSPALGNGLRPRWPDRFKLFQAAFPVQKEKLGARSRLLLAAGILIMRTW